MACAFSAYLMRNRDLQGAAHDQYFIHEGLAQGPGSSWAFQEVRVFLGIGELWGFLEGVSVLILRCSLLYPVRQ